MKVESKGLGEIDISLVTSTNEDCSIRFLGVSMLDILGSNVGEFILEYLGSSSCVDFFLNFFGLNFLNYGNDIKINKSKLTLTF